MGKAYVGMIRELREQITRFAGESIAKEIMEGSKEITEKTSQRKVGEWVKGSMERFDALVDEKTRVQIMENCGYNCADVHMRVTENAKARRRKYESVDEFLEAEQRSPARGTRLVRQGDLLYQFYTPQSFKRPARCYCGLLRGLPSDETVSLTYCHCAKGFVKKVWEAILEKPVEVDLLQSAVSGAQECRFAIHL